MTTIIRWETSWHPDRNHWAVSFEPQEPWRSGYALSYLLGAMRNDRALLPLGIERVKLAIDGQLENDAILTDAEPAQVWYCADHVLVVEGFSALSDVAAMALIRAEDFLRLALWIERVFALGPEDVGTAEIEPCEFEIVNDGLPPLDEYLRLWHAAGDRGQPFQGVMP